MVAARRPTPSGRVLAFAAAQLRWNQERESSYYDDVDDFTSTG